MSDTEAVHPSSNEDRELLARLRQADAAARSEFYDRLHGKLRTHFQRKLPNRADADDCANEVITRALEGIADGATPESLDKWVWGIARNVLLEQYRSSTRDLPIDLQDVAEAGEAATADADLGLEYGKREAFHAIRAVIPRLGAVQQEVMTAFLAQSLLLMEDVKGAQLADVLGADWSPHRVNRELDRARESVAHDVGVLSVARSARSCPHALDLTGGNPDAAPTLSRRRWIRLAKHAQTCPTCAPTYKRSQRNAAWALSPGLLLAGTRIDRTLHPVTASQSGRLPTRMHSRLGARVYLVPTTIVSLLLMVIVISQAAAPTTHPREAEAPPSPNVEQPHVSPTAASPGPNPTAADSSVPATPSTGGPAPLVTVPNVVGATRAEAQTALAQSHLQATYTSVHGSAPKDQVLATSPAAGAVVDANSVVAVSLSAADQATMPNTVGTTTSAMYGTLGQAGFTNITISYTAATSPAWNGYVTQQSVAPGAIALLASPITITVALTLQVTSATLDNGYQCSVAMCGNRDIVTVFSVQTNVPGPITVNLAYEFLDTSCHVTGTLTTNWFSVSAPTQTWAGSGAGTDDIPAWWVELRTDPAGPGQPITKRFGDCHPQG